MASPRGYLGEAQNAQGALKSSREGIGPTRLLHEVGLSNGTPRRGAQQRRRCSLKVYELPPFNPFARSQIS